MAGAFSLRQRDRRLPQPYEDADCDCEKKNFEGNSERQTINKPFDRCQDEGADDDDQGADQDEQRVPGVSRASQYPEYHALYRLGAATIQGIFLRLIHVACVRFEVGTLRKPVRAACDDAI
jgi:hypothetical protein